MRVETRADPDSLPPGGAALFAEVARRSFFLGADWYRAVLGDALPRGAEPCFVVCMQGDRPAAVVPMLREGEALGEGRTLGSLTTLYTCLFQPCVAADAAPEAVRRAGAAFGRFCRAHAAVRLDALDPGWAGLAPFLAGARRAGMLPLRFDHFGNWHERVEALSWAQYLAARPGVLRETVRRRLGKAERDPELRFALIDGPGGLEAGIAAFEDVYARSWKEPEPFPTFNAALIRRTAALGLLRLGLLFLRGQPVAAQFWIVENRRATVLKLAHDEAHKSISPGTVLTAMTIRLLLDRGGVDELDFGRGDDPYKRQWARERRQRVGVVLANPLRAEGLVLLGRHAAGRGRKLARSLLHSRPAAG